MTASKEDFSWSAFYGYRVEARGSYPSVYALKVKKKLFQIIMEELSDGQKVLDVGASTRGLHGKIQKELPSVTYRSMDIDRAHKHDYYDLGDIKETFDLIVLSEVIEHIEFDEGMRLLKNLSSKLGAGGRLIITTPNIHHPNMWWRDPDHKVAYSYDVLGGALLSAGLGIKGLYRIHNDQFIRRLFRLYVMAPLHRYLDVDFARSIVAVGIKK